VLREPQCNRGSESARCGEVRVANGLWYPIRCQLENNAVPVPPHDALDKLKGFAARQKGGSFGSVANATKVTATVSYGEHELRGDAEDGVDELTLSNRIALADPADLPFAICMHRLVTLD